MTTIKTNNFNFQGIGFPTKSSGLIPPPPPPPPIVYVSPIVNIITDREEINGNPTNNIVKVIFDKTPCGTNPPTYYEGSVQIPITGPLGDPITQDTDFTQTDFLNEFAIGQDVTQIFGPTGNEYTEGDVIVEFEFHWEDTSGNIIHTETVENDLGLILGCPDSGYTEYNVDANVNDGTCSTLIPS